MIPPGIVTKTNMGVPVWSFSDCTLGGQKGGRYLKNPFFCTTQQSFACWWMLVLIRHMWELLADNIRKASCFLRLEIKCSVNYSGKCGNSYKQIPCCCRWIIDEHVYFTLQLFSPYPLWRGYACDSSKINMQWFLSGNFRGMGHSSSLDSFINKNIFEWAE